MGVLWLGADWPVHDLAERYLYFMHMTQHLLFTLVAAPILIAGMPPWMLRTLLAPRPVRRVFAFMTRPFVALLFVQRASCCSRTGPKWSPRPSARS